MFNTLRCLLCSLTFLPLAALGCEPTYAEMVDMAKRDRAIEERYVSKLFAESESVVVGVVTDVRDSGDPSYAQLATVSVDESLVGPEERSITFLMYKREEAVALADKDEISPLDSIRACGEPYDPEQEQPYVQKGFRALIYVKDGVLRRAVSFPVEPEPLIFNPRSEIEFLQGNRHDGRGNEG